MQFIHRELRAAISPRVGLSHLLEHWPEIARALAETPRKRTRQELGILC